MKQIISASAGQNMRMTPARWCMFLAVSNKEKPLSLRDAHLWPLFITWEWVPCDIFLMDLCLQKTKDLHTHTRMCTSSVVMATVNHLDTGFKDHTARCNTDRYLAAWIKPKVGPECAQLTMNPFIHDHSFNLYFAAPIRINKFFTFFLQMGLSLMSSNRALLSRERYNELFLINDSIIQFYKIGRYVLNILKICNYIIGDVIHGYSSNK